MEEEFGYPDIKNITKFIRNCISDNELLRYFNNGISRDKNASNFWDDVCNGHKKDYSYFLKNDDALIETQVDNEKPFYARKTLINLIIEYLDYLKDKYNISIIIRKLILDTYDDFVDALSGKIRYDDLHKASLDYLTQVPTHDTALITVFYSISNIIQKAKSKNENLEYYFSDCFTYKSIAQRIIDECTFINQDNWNKPTNREELYKSLDEFATERCLNEKIVERFRNIFLNTSSVTSANLHTIIDYLEEYVISNNKKDIQRQFIERFLVDNFFKALSVFNLNEDINKLKSDIRKVYKGEYKRMSDFNYPEPINYNLTSLFLSYKATISAFVENNTDISRKELYETILFNSTGADKETKEITPLLLNCYCPYFWAWQYARICVYFKDFEKAYDFYKSAFAFINLFGFYAPLFIKEALIFSLYYKVTYSNADMCVKGKNKTPLPEDIKRYWNYGRLIGLIHVPVNKAYHYIWYKDYYFWNNFPYYNFVDINESYYEMGTSLLNCQGYDLNLKFKGTNNEDSDDLKNPREIVEKFVLKFRNNIENINKRQPDILAPKNDNQKRLMSLLSQCLKYGRYYECLLEFTENRLDDKRINFDIRNYNNSTVLIEALYSYKLIRYKNYVNPNEMSIPQIYEFNQPNYAINNLEKRYKNIILKIIESSNVDTLLAKTLDGKMDALQLAIDVFDYDILKAIIDKTGLINKIGYACELPIQYAKVRYQLVCKNQEEFIEAWIARYNNLALKFEKSFNIEDEEKNEKLIDISKLNKYTPYFTYIENFGSYDVKEEQKKELNRIIEYLQEKSNQSN